MPENRVPEILLTTATITDDEDLRTLDGSQAVGYSNSMSTNFEQMANIGEENSAETEVENLPEIIEHTGVVDMTAQPMEALQAVAAGKVGEVFQIFHGEKPHSEFPDPDHLMDMFPTLFPYGRCGPGNHKRERPLSLEQWTRHLLNLSSRKFAEHYSFMFVMFDIHLFFFLLLF